LVRLHERHFPNLHGRAAARAVSHAVSRYQGTAWPRDCRARRRPDGLSGDCFDVLVLCHGSLPGEDTLRHLFAVKATALEFTSRTAMLPVCGEDTDGDGGATTQRRHSRSG
jgi:hypothetical protein